MSNLHGRIMNGRYSDGFIKREGENLFKRQFIRYRNSLVEYSQRMSAGLQSFVVHL
jgi:hypothetical protein